MADTFLTIGGYTFEGFGVPEEINGGGAHHLVVHKMLGGARIIDALGPDDDAIVFKGRFRGAGAMDDAILLDAMRRAGAPVTLTYWNQTITVLIAVFRWSFQRFYEVPYSIECMVLANQSAQAPADQTTLDGAVGADVGLAQSTTAGSAAASAAVAPVVAGYQTNAPLSSATQAQDQQFQADVNGAQVRLGGLSDAADVPSTPVGQGGDPTAIAAGLTGQAQTMTDGAAAQNAGPVLARVNTNLNAPGGGIF